MVDGKKAHEIEAGVRYAPGETGERPWGRWRVLETGAGFCVKRIEVEPGHRLSLQYHHHRSEDWIIVGGAGLVELNTDQIQVKSGDRIRIPLLAHHRIRNTGGVTLIFVEVQHGAYLDENDIVRVEDDYGR
jgi:mannose-6-phosphate isomerase